MLLFLIAGSCKPDIVDKNTKKHSQKVLTIPSNVTIITARKYEDADYIRIVFEKPSTLTTIGAYAFAKNKLTKLSLPDSVTTIREHAFANNQLTEITLGEGIKRLDPTIFANNKKITSIFVKNPSTVKLISPSLLPKIKPATDATNEKTTEITKAITAEKDKKPDGKEEIVPIIEVIPDEDGEPEIKKEEPRVTSYKITSSPVFMNSYIPGNTITVEVNFSQKVSSKKSAEDDVRLYMDLKIGTIRDGETSKKLECAPALGVEKLLCTYTVEEEKNIEDTDGIDISELKVENGWLKNEKGVALTKVSAPLGIKDTHKIIHYANNDDIKVTEVSKSPSSQKPYFDDYTGFTYPYKTGETISTRITLNKDIAIVGTRSGDDDSFFTYQGAFITKENVFIATQAKGREPSRPFKHEVRKKDDRWQVFVDNKDSVETHLNITQDGIKPRLDKVDVGGGKKKPFKTSDAIYIRVRFSEAIVLKEQDPDYVPSITINIGDGLRKMKMTLRDKEVNTGYKKVPIGNFNHFNRITKKGCLQRSLQRKTRKPTKEHI